MAAPRAGLDIWPGGAAMQGVRAVGRVRPGVPSDDRSVGAALAVQSGGCGSVRLTQS